MDDKSRIRLDIPDPEDFDLGSPHVYVPVPSEIVGGLIDLLVCFLDHYRAEEGSEKDYQVWDRLATSAAQALAGLLSANGAYYHGGGARELVEQIDHFCNWRDTRPTLYDSSRNKRLHAFAALREDARTADIVDALEALHDERERRRKEPKQQPAAAEQGPAADGDPGWEF